MKPSARGAQSELRILARQCGESDIETRRRYASGRAQSKATRSSRLMPTPRPLGRAVATLPRASGARRFGSEVWSATRGARLKRDLVLVAAEPRAVCDRELACHRAGGRHREDADPGAEAHVAPTLDHVDEDRTEA